MPSDSDLFYLLDTDNRIVRVGGPWDAFVLDNLGPGGEGRDALAERVIGRALEDFIHDAPTLALLTRLIDGARFLKWERRLDYRCDSPDQKRYMSMSLRPEAEGRVILTHTVLRSEPVLPAFHWRAATQGAQRCSLCNRVRIGDAWVEPDHPRVRGAPQPLPVAHTVCPVCSYSVL